MSAIVSVFYPLWYVSYRQRVKEILNSDTNAAKSILDSAITEHDTNAANDLDENGILHHAKKHLDSFVNTGQTKQKDSTINVLNEGIVDPVSDPV